MKKILLSMYLGNALEMYDFVLCGILITKIAHSFFPTHSQFLSVLLSLLVFGIGFLARPLGSIYFGHIGDRYGRKVALSQSLIGMSMATFLLACLPSHEILGVVAPLLFLFLRLAQGFCIGGEGQGSSTFVIEHYWHRKPTLHGAIYATSNGMGALLATVVSLVLTLPSMPSWGWRAAFLLGSLVGLIGLWLRLYFSETPLFEQVEERKETLHKPLLWVLKNNLLNFLTSFLFMGVASSVTYVGFAFINVFLTSVLHMESSMALGYACIGTFFAMSSVLLGGMVAEKWGAQRTILVSVILLTLLAIPIHVLLARGNPASILIALILLAIPTGGTCGPAPYFIAQFFPSKARYSGAAFSNNLAQGLLGGFQPFVAMALIHRTGIMYSPAFYLIIISLSFLTIFLLYSHKHPVSSTP